MRFGICIGADEKNVRVARECGYDYVEVNLSQVAAFDDARLARFRAELNKYSMNAETCNGFFFSFEDGYLSGDKVDFQVLEEYIRRALGKAAVLGVKVAVIGSGKARRILDEAHRAEGEEQFARVLRLAGDIGAEYGIKIVIEPLRREETNLVNTVADGVALCQLTNHPNVAVLADFFHVTMMDEGMDTIRNCGRMLQHVHIARGYSDRQMPVNTEDEKDVKLWAAALKDNGYDARISLEGGYGENPVATFHKMRQVLKEFE